MPARTGTRLEKRQAYDALADPEQYQGARSQGFTPPPDWSLKDFHFHAGDPKPNTFAGGNHGKLLQGQRSAQEPPHDHSLQHPTEVLDAQALNPEQLAQACSADTRWVGERVATGILQCDAADPDR